MIELARQIATKAHEGQFRRDGVTPYITHPEAVAKYLAKEMEEIIATAWLHDVLEDTGETADTLKAKGIPERVVKAVEILTKKEGENYLIYLERVKNQSFIARKVKIIDMLVNISDNPTPKQVKKYAHGLLFLLT